MRRRVGSVWEGDVWGRVWRGGVEGIVQDRAISGVNELMDVRTTQ